MNKAARILSAGAAVAALVLTGCSEPPSAAAVVDGHRIADSEVTQAAQTLTALTGTELNVALKQAAFDLAVGEASTRIVERAGARITQAEKDEVLAQNELASAVAATPGGRPWGDAVATTYLAIDKVGGDAYKAQLKDMPISLNPRYGTWSSEQLTMIDSSLARVADPTTLRR